MNGRHCQICGVQGVHAKMWRSAGVCGLSDELDSLADHPVVRTTNAQRAGGFSAGMGLGNAGESEYTPMIYAIFDRGSWGRYRDAIESTWPAYMDGERTLSEAAADLIEARAKAILGK